MYYRVLCLLVVILAIGCNSNPYPDRGLYFQQKLDPPKEEKPYGLQVDNVINFDEGIESEFFVKGWVQGDKAIITFDGLPSAAHFDESTGRVTWKPSMDAANDPNDPMVIERSYEVRVSLRGAQDPDRSLRLQQPILLIVKDRPQKFEIVGLPSYDDLREGQTYNIALQVIDEDFPSGPFDIAADGLPRGAVISRVPGDPTKIMVTFRPSYDFVTADDTGLKVVPWMLHISDRRHQIDQNIQWSVHDVRLLPKIISPRQVKQGGSEINFSIRVEDPNGEVVPELTNDAPPFGNLTVETAASWSPGDEGNPFKMVAVKWSGIPADKAGQKESLRFNTCVKSSATQMLNCSNFDIDVNFAASASGENL